MKSIKLLNATSNTIDDANYLHKHSAVQLLSRLELVLMKPKRILDLGCATGESTQLLKQYFPEAEIVGVDLADQRIKRAKEKYPDIEFFTADAEKLPFESQMFDMVVTNAMLHWIPELSLVLREIHRVLTIGGLFAFSYYGPDTFTNLGQPKGCFYDMHIMGDALVNEQYNDPILDVEQCVVDYDTQADILSDLHATAEIDLIDPTQENVLELRYELVYGHAWKAHEPMSRKIDDQTSSISIDALRRSLRVN